MEEFDFPGANENQVPHNPLAISHHYGAFGSI
jgi:hypothetical protein